MNETSKKRRLNCLIVLSILLFACDVAALPLIPALVFYHFHDPAPLFATFRYDFDDGLGNLLHVILRDAWQRPDTAVLSLVLMACGVCAAAVLARAIRTMANISDHLAV